MKIETKFKVGDVLCLVDKIRSEITEAKTCSFCEGRGRMLIRGANETVKEIECPECDGAGTVRDIIQKYGIVSIKIIRKAFEETENGCDGVTYTYRCIDRVETIDDGVSCTHRFVDENDTDGVGCFFAINDEIHNNIYETKEEARARARELNK